MAKKGTRKKTAGKAAKKKSARKTATRKTTRKTTGKKTSSAGRKTLTFKCISDTCAANTGPKSHIGAKKTKVTLRAPANKVTIQFFDPDTGAPLRPPFVETTTTGPIVINKGSSKTFTVRDDAPKHNFYDAKCEDPDCGKVVEPPEMIVP
jgi:hypothetical protein